RGIFHRCGRDPLKGLATVASNTNGGMDLQPLGAEVTGVGRHSKTAKIFPWPRKAHSEAPHLLFFLVGLRERFLSFLLQARRLGDEGRDIVQKQCSPLTYVAGIERQRGRGAK